MPEPYPRHAIRGRCAFNYQDIRNWGPAKGNAWTQYQDNCRSNAYLRPYKLFSRFRRMGKQSGYLSRWPLIRSKDKRQSQWKLGLGKHDEAREYALKLSDAQDILPSTYQELL